MGGDSEEHGSRPDVQEQQEVPTSPFSHLSLLSPPIQVLEPKELVSRLRKWKSTLQISYYWQKHKQTLL